MRLVRGHGASWAGNWVGEPLGVCMTRRIGLRALLDADVEHWSSRYKLRARTRQKVVADAIWSFGSTVDGNAATTARSEHGDRPQRDDARDRADRALLHARRCTAGRSRDRVHVVYSRSEERAARLRRASTGSRSATTDMERGDRAPGRRTSWSSACRTTCTRRRSRSRAEARQGRAVHQAARAQRRRGEADPGDRRERRRLRTATSRTSSTRRRR